MNDEPIQKYETRRTGILRFVLRDVAEDSWTHGDFGVVTVKKTVQKILQEELVRTTFPTMVGEIREDRYFWQDVPTVESE